MSGILEASDFSKGRLEEVRSALSSLVPSNQIVVTCGSYARREASPESDMDYYCILGSAQDSAPSWAGGVRAEVLRIVGKLPSEKGAFATNITREQLLSNFGGALDDNLTITRRMLYLLEGEFLTNEKQFLSVRHEIIEKYVSDTPRDHQVAFYLLNDIIRYWRTLAVDYAHKTSDEENPKPWGIRNIKLIFSRKLIYASGLFAVALTADRTEADKMRILEMLFAMTPIDRIKYICGEANSQRLFEMYEIFLSQIADPDIRGHLDNLKRDDKGTDLVFRRLKNEGHYFSRELMGLFHRTFHPSHPIHMAVIF